MCFWIVIVESDKLSLEEFVCFLKFILQCHRAWLSQKVDYPLELDVYDFCSDELRKKLEAPRQVYSLS